MVRDPLLSPPTPPWSLMLYISLNTGVLVAIITMAITGSIRAALMAGMAAYCLASMLMAAPLFLPWVGAQGEFLSRELERRFTPQREREVVFHPRPEPTRILNGEVWLGDADAPQPDDRALRELLVGFVRAAQVHGWGIRDLVGVRIRTSAGVVAVTDPLWRAVTDLLAARGMLRKAQSGSVPITDPEAIIAWARGGRLGPEVRMRLSPYLAPSPAGNGDRQGEGV